jgi:hypothetical protein
MVTFAMPRLSDHTGYARREALCFLIRVVEGSSSEAKLLAANDDGIIDGLLLIFQYFNDHIITPRGAHTHV